MTATLAHIHRVSARLQPGIIHHEDPFAWALIELAEAHWPDLRVDIRCGACRGRGYWDTWLGEGWRRLPELSAVPSAQGVDCMVFREECSACLDGTVIGRRLWSVAELLGGASDRARLFESTTTGNHALLKLGARVPAASPGARREHLAVLADRLMADGARLGRWLAAYLAGDEARDEVEVELARAVRPIVMARREARYHQRDMAFAQAMSGVRGARFDTLIIDDPAFETRHHRGPWPAVDLTAAQLAFAAERSMANLAGAARLAAGSVSDMSAAMAALRGSLRQRDEHDARLDRIAAEIAVHGPMTVDDVRDQARSLARAAHRGEEEALLAMLRCTDGASWRDEIPQRPELMPAPVIDDAPEPPRSRPIGRRLSRRLGRRQT